MIKFNLVEFDDKSYTKLYDMGYRKLGGILSSDKISTDAYLRRSVSAGSVYNDMYTCIRLSDVLDEDPIIMKENIHKLLLKNLTEDMYTAMLNATDWSAGIQHQLNALNIDYTRDTSGNIAMVTFDLDEDVVMNKNDYGRPKHIYSDKRVVFTVHPSLDSRYGMKSTITSAPDIIIFFGLHLAGYFSYHYMSSEGFPSESFELNLSINSSNRLKTEEDTIYIDTAEPVSIENIREISKEFSIEFSIGYRVHRINTDMYINIVADELDDDALEFMENSDDTYECEVTILSRRTTRRIKLEDIMNTRSNLIFIRDYFIDMYNNALERSASKIVALQKFDEDKLPNFGTIGYSKAGVSKLSDVSKKVYALESLKTDIAMYLKDGSISDSDRFYEMVYIHTGENSNAFGRQMFQSAHTSNILNYSRFNDLSDAYVDFTDPSATTMVSMHTTANLKELMRDTFQNMMYRKLVDFKGDPVSQINVYNITHELGLTYAYMTSESTYQSFVSTLTDIIKSGVLSDAIIPIEESDFVVKRLKTSKWLFNAKPIPNPELSISIEDLHDVIVHRASLTSQTFSYVSKHKRLSIAELNEVIHAVIDKSITVEDVDDIVLSGERYGKLKYNDTEFSLNVYSLPFSNPKPTYENGTGVTVFVRVNIDTNELIIERVNVTPLHDHMISLLTSVQNHNANLGAEVNFEDTDISIGKYYTYTRDGLAYENNRHDNVMVYLYNSIKGNQTYMNNTGLILTEDIGYVKRAIDIKDNIILTTKDESSVLSIFDKPMRCGWLDDDSKYNYVSIPDIAAYNTDTEFEPDVSIITNVYGEEIHVLVKAVFLKKMKETSHIGVELFNKEGDVISVMNVDGKVFRASKSHTAVIPEMLKDDEFIYLSIFPLNPKEVINIPEGTPPSQVLRDSYMCTVVPNESSVVTAFKIMKDQGKTRDLKFDLK